MATTYAEGAYPRLGGREKADELAYNAALWFPDNVVGFGYPRFDPTAQIRVTGADESTQRACLRQISERSGYELEFIEVFTPLPEYDGTRGAALRLTEARLRHLGVIIGEKYFVFQAWSDVHQQGLVEDEMMLSAQHDKQQELFGGWIAALETLHQKCQEALKRLGLEKPARSSIVAGVPIEPLRRWIINEAAGPHLEQIELAEHALASLSRVTQPEKAIKLARAMLLEMRTVSDLLVHNSAVSS